MSFQNDGGRPVDELIGCLPATLAALAREAFDAASEAQEAEAQRIRRMVSLIRAAGAAHAGGRAHGALQRVFGLSRQSMQEYSTIAARWRDDELETLLRLRDANGEPVRVSRLVVLARAPRSLRNDLLRRVVRDGLAVKAIRALVNDSRRHSAV